MYIEAVLMSKSRNIALSLSDQIPSSPVALQCRVYMNSRESVPMYWPSRFQITNFHNSMYIYTVLSNSGTEATPGWEISRDQCRIAQNIIALLLVRRTSPQRRIVVRSYVVKKSEYLGLGPGANLPLVRNKLPLVLIQNCVQKNRPVSLCIVIIVGNQNIMNI